MSIVFNGKTLSGGGVSRAELHAELANTVSSFDKIATDLNGKADTDLTNVTPASGLRRLIEVYQDGTEWYKVFAETNPTTGAVRQWCEQGGVWAAGVTSITFQKPFASKNYQVLTQCTNMATTNNGTSTSTGYLSGAIGISSKTTTGFSRVGTTDGNKQIRDWVAMGYLN